jgi:flagellum-specific ATP synthase
MSTTLLDPVIALQTADLSPTPPSIDISRFAKSLERLDPVRSLGKVVDVAGLVIESSGPSAQIGELCEIHYDRSKPPMVAEVVGFHNGRVQLMPFGQLDGVRIGSEVMGTRTSHQVAVGDSLLGRVLDGLGNPADEKGRLTNTKFVPAHREPPNALTRKRIEEPLQVGVRAIDGCLTLGRGQRVGIFAGSGVGKSTLLGMIARNTSADINVICLCGERGREVREFIDDSLGEEGLARSVVVVATSDQPPLLRIKATLVATAIAEYFRDEGKDVLLMMDSVTRLALAQREVGLSTGEPPTTRGYTPSVFSMLPRLLERAGTGETGSITGLYTVLVDGDDMNEPVADAARGILDGHIVLSRALAHQNHFPAIDVLQSVSRVMPAIVSSEQMSAAGRLRGHLATYRDAEDLINIGAYVVGSNPRIDEACSRIDGVKEFLKQPPSEKSPYIDTQSHLLSAA